MCLLIMSSCHDGVQKAYIHAAVLHTALRWPECCLQFSAPHLITIIQEYDHPHWLTGTREAVYLPGHSPAKTEKISSESLNVRKIVRTSDGTLWGLTRGKGFFLNIRKSIP